MRKAILLPLASCLWSLALVVLVGCTERSSQGEAERSERAASAPPLAGPAGGQPNRAPSVRSARIAPNPVLLNGSILVQVDGEDMDGDPLTFRYHWLVNGDRIEGQTQSTLNPRLAKRGDLLAVDVVPFDGKVEGVPYRTDPVVVGNTPPEVVRVVLAPSQVRAGDRLRAQVEGADADQDPIRYKFRWWRNNQLVSEGEAGELETVGWVRDDLIVVEVTPFDAAGAGQARFSEPIAIANSPPTITSVPPTAIDAGRYQYAVKATDPEGDPLTYGLDGAPPGMTIDTNTGRIEWRIMAGRRETHRVRVSVHDNREGYAFQEFALTPEKN
ncbi:MAG: hypothetical protein EPO64_11280 [Nitrospirae bacterium]|nr:MAG: hypothetical protein EPO64_11280 [Nitrospirota bacterium]